MNTRHTNSHRTIQRLTNRRSHAGQAGLRAWLRNCLSQTVADSTRRLMCERLESRYAMHGMPWSAGAFGFDESYLSVNDFEARETAHVRGYMLEGEASASSANADHICDDAMWLDSRRPRLRAEGEGGGRGAFDSIGKGGLANSQPNARPAEPLDLIKLPPNSSIGSSNALADNNDLFKSDSQIKNSSTKPVSQGFIGIESTVIPTLPFSIQIELLGSNASRGTSTDSPVGSNASNAGSISANSFAPNNNAFSPRPSNVVTDLSLTSRSSSTTSTGTVPLQSGSGFASARTLDSSGYSSSTTVRSTVASVLLNDRAERSLVAGENKQSTQWQAEEAGLLDELRSVVDRLATERDTQRSSSTSKPSLSAQEKGLDSSLAQDAVSRAHQTGQDESGLLELATPVERLAPDANLDAYAAQQEVAAEHRGLALASMGLHREFDLDGQSVGSLEGVVDPARLLDTTPQLAAEAVDAWHDEVTSADEVASSLVDADNSVISQSLLPLSFLAVGGLLIQSRRRYRKGANSTKRVSIVSPTPFRP